MSNERVAERDLAIGALTGSISGGLGGYLTRRTLGGALMGAGSGLVGGGAAGTALNLNDLGSDVNSAISGLAAGGLTGALGARGLSTLMRSKDKKIIDDEILKKIEESKKTSTTNPLWDKLPEPKYSKDIGLKPYKLNLPKPLKKEDVDARDRRMELILNNRYRDTSHIKTKSIPYRQEDLFPELGPFKYSADKAFYESLKAFINKIASGNGLGLGQKGIRGAALGNILAS